MASKVYLHDSQKYISVANGRQLTTKDSWRFDVQARVKKSGQFHGKASFLCQQCAYEADHSCLIPTPDSQLDEQVYEDDITVTCTTIHSKSKKPTIHVERWKYSKPRSYFY